MEQVKRIEVDIEKCFYCDFIMKTEHNIKITPRDAMILSGALWNKIYNVCDKDGISLEYVTEYCKDEIRLFNILDGFGLSTKKSNEKRIYGMMEKVISDVDYFSDEDKNEDDPEWLDYPFN